MAMELVTQLPYDHPYRWDGRIFGGPQLWRPSNLGDALALWLDAEDTASITLNGATVSQWNDKSSNGRHVSQAAGANQPTYTAGGLNGKPVLTYTGTNFLIKTNDTFMQNVPAVSAFSVVRYTDYVTNRRAVNVTSTSGTGRLILLGTTSAAQSLARRLLTDAFSTSSGAAVAANAPVIHATELDFVNNSNTAFVNGVAGSAASFTSGGGNSEDALTNIQMGSSLTTQLFLGAMAETVFVNGILSTDNRQRLEGYFAWKWLIQANLDVGHPYKNTPPIV